MQFSIKSAGLRVTCRDWPGYIAPSIEPFVADGRGKWTVSYRASAPDVRIDTARRVVECPTSNPFGGLIAGLSAAAEERSDMVAAHAAACALGKHCLLLVAYSGGGKSTLATLLEHTTLLSDEMVLLRRTRGGLFAHGTPIRSACPREPSKRRALVSAILFLRKAKENRLEAVSTATAVEEVLPQIWASPKARPSTLLEKVARILGDIPAYRFHFLNTQHCTSKILPLLPDWPGEGT